jgi:integrase
VRSAIRALLFRASQSQGRSHRSMLCSKKWSWLSEIEQDLALVMERRSKFDRVVLAERIVQAGLTLVTEAEAFARYPFKRAIGIRNGLIIALLAVCPIRIKNYAALEIGRTFKQEQGSWWIALPYGTTKTDTADQRPVPDYLQDALDLYLTEKACIDRLAAGDKIPSGSPRGRDVATRPRTLGRRSQKSPLRRSGSMYRPTCSGLLLPRRRRAMALTCRISPARFSIIPIRAIRRNTTFARPP